MSAQMKTENSIYALKCRWDNDSWKCILSANYSPSMQTLMVQIFDFSYGSDFCFVWYMFILDGDSSVDFRDLFIQLTEEFFLPWYNEGVC